MSLTQAQVETAFTVKKTFDFTTGVLTLADVTNWASLGINLKGSNFPLNTDELKVNFKIADPTGNTVFQSAGYSTNDYTTATWNETQSIPYSSTYSLPTDINGNYLNGTYSIVFKFQLITSGGTLTCEVNYSQNVCSCQTLCGGNKTISIETIVDYSTAIITATDKTNYGDYFAITRQNTIYPPPSTGYASQTTSAAANVYVNNLPTKRVVTGTWSAKIVSDVQYAVTADTFVVCRFEGSKEFDVTADQICKMLCVMANWRMSFYTKEKGKKNTADIERAFALANADFNLGVNAVRCGKDPSAYFANIYVLLGIDPNCDCGCDSVVGTPIIPTSVINGTDGRTAEFRVSGTIFQWKYEDEGGWTNLFDFSTLATQGANGENGTTVLFNEPAVAQSTVIQNGTTSAEDLFSENLPANTFQSDGDIVEVEYQMSISAGVAISTISFGGTVTLFQAPLSNQIDLDVRGTQFISGKLTYSKYNSNSVLVQHKFTNGLYGIGLTFGEMVFSNVVNMTVTGLDFTSTIPIVLSTTANTIGGVSVPYFIVTSKKIAQ